VTPIRPNKIEFCYYLSYYDAKSSSWGTESKFVKPKSCHALSMLVHFDMSNQLGLGYWIIATPFLSGWLKSTSPKMKTIEEILLYKVNKPWRKVKVKFIKTIWMNAIWNRFVCKFFYAPNMCGAVYVCMHGWFYLWMSACMRSKNKECSSAWMLSKSIECNKKLR
jgi:hypothetical protein